MREIYNLKLLILEEERGWRLSNYTGLSIQLKMLGKEPQRKPSESGEWNARQEQHMK